VGSGKVGVGSEQWEGGRENKKWETGHGTWEVGRKLRASDVMNTITYSTGKRRVRVSARGAALTRGSIPTTPFYRRWAVI
jgi:hypothetical protein